MKIDFITPLLFAISTQIPFLLIWIIGISLSLYFRQRNPRKFLLVAIAFLVFLLNTIGNSVFSAWTTFNLVSTGGPSVGFTQIAVGFLSMLSLVIAWGILFFAIFSPKFNLIEGVAQ